MSPRSEPALIEGTLEHRAGEARLLWSESSAETDHPETGLAPITPEASSNEGGILESSTQGVGQPLEVSSQGTKEISASANVSQEREAGVSQDLRVSTASEISDASLQGLMNQLPGLIQGLLESSLSYKRSSGRH